MADGDLDRVIETILKSRAKAQRRKEGKKGLLVNGERAFHGAGADFADYTLVKYATLVTIVNLTGQAVFGFFVVSLRI